MWASSFHADAGSQTDPPVAKAFTLSAELSGGRDGRWDRGPGVADGLSQPAEPVAERQAGLWEQQNTGHMSSARGRPCAGQAQLGSLLRGELAVRRKSEKRKKPDILLQPFGSQKD